MSRRNNVIHVRFGPNGGRTTPADMALELCAKALELESSEPWRATMLYSQAVLIDKDCLIAHVELGVLAYKEKYYERARYYWTESLRIAPNSFEAAYNLGSLEYEQRNLTEAKGWLRLALSITPGARDAQQLFDDILEREKWEAVNLNNGTRRKKKR